MKKNSIFRFFVAMAFCAVFLFGLAGCIPESNSANDQQVASREYMSKVNLIMDDLNVDLQSFSDSVSENDIVGMKAQAEKAYKAIDSIEALTPPDNLADIQKEYLKGCKSLESALKSYIDLYAEIDSDMAKEDVSFDSTDYEKQLEKIQELYAKGIASLETADKKATEM